MPSDLRTVVEQAWLIAVREYRELVRSRSFVLTTLLTPAAFGAMLGGGVLLGKHTAMHERIAVIGNQLPLAQAVAGELRRVPDGPTVVEIDSPVTAALEAALNQRIEQKQLSGYLSLAPSPGLNGQRTVFVSGSALASVSTAQLQSAVVEAEARQALLARGVPAGTAETLLQHTQVEAERLREGKLQRADDKLDFAGASSLVFLLYVAVLIYGMNVARSVVQEKTSRIYEVLLASARADSLMAGKLLGVGAAGLTQVAVWFVLLALLTGSSLAETYGVHGLQSLGIAPLQIVYFAVFSTLGFFFYNGVCAGVGAMMGAEQELQQFSIIIVAPLIVSVLMMHYVLTNPSAPASVALSLIPPFTPIIMYLRVCAATPPAWQIALSVALLVLAIAAVVWLAARVYRVGILMYGKRPTLPEAFRWLRQS